MKNLDEQEKKIVRALIKDPRLSDNQVSKLTRVPVMSVNRKRKALEKDGILNYFCYLDTSRYGLNILPARQLYIVKLKIGITKKNFIDIIKKDPVTRNANTSFIYESYVGEKDGHLVWAVVIEGGKGNEIVEIFNGKFVPMLKKNFGNDSIVEVFTVRLTSQLRLLHNYMPLINMENGKIKKEWLDDYIFVD